MQSFLNSFTINSVFSNHSFSGVVFLRARDVGVFAKSHGLFVQSNLYVLCANSSSAKRFVLLFSVHPGAGYT